MTDESIHLLSGAYAVDAVDDLERVRFERHLETCSDCRAEVDSLRAAAAQLGHLAVMTPPARLRDQVLKDISAVRPLPPEVAVETETRVAETRQSLRRTGRTPRRTTRWLAAAAAVIAIGGGATAVVTQPWDRAAAPTIAEKVISAPDATRHSQAFPGGASAEVVNSRSVGKAVIIAKAMQAAPSGKDYQLWLKQGDRFVSAGLMSDQADQTVVLDGDAETATAVGITVEPDGGSAQPTSDPLAVIPLV